MAINRGPFNALIDDDGSGTTGSVWNKSAIAGVVLDPVDAAINPINAPSASPHIFGGPIQLAATSSGVISRATADGADTLGLVLCGGGTVGQTRGGYVQVIGNEASSGGSVLCVVGNVAGSAITFHRGDTVAALTIDGTSGRCDFTNSDTKWTFNSTHASGPQIVFQHNGATLAQMGTLLAVLGSGSATDLCLHSGGDWHVHRHLLPSFDNATSMGLSTKRWTTVWAVNGTIQTSDARQKIDIMDSNLGLAFLERVRPVRYRWRQPAAGHDTPQYGVLAQDLIALGVSDAFVHGTEADGYGTNYASFTAPLIAAVQELSRRLAALERQSDGTL